MLTCSMCVQITSAAAPRTLYMRSSIASVYMFVGLGGGLVVQRQRVCVCVCVCRSSVIRHFVAGKHL